MASTITIFTRDHKHSGNTNEYQRDTPVEYIQKYSFSAPDDTIKASLLKGTTSWFPNQISLGVTSKTDENILDAPEIAFEVDKGGSKKEASFTQLNECKIKGVRISFQLEALSALPIVELFITYRRAGNKATVRDVIIRRIKFSHRIVLDGEVSGLNVDEAVIKAGIVKAPTSPRIISEHADHRPPRKRRRLLLDSHLQQEIRYMHCIVALSDDKWNSH